MDYKQALKELSTKKPQENYLVIKLNYVSLVLPYKDGLNLISALGMAEQLENPYSSDKTRIISFNESFEANIMSAEKYRNYKIAALLNVSLAEVEQMKQQETATT